MYPDWESNQQPPGARDNAQPSHTGQAQSIKKNNTCLLTYTYFCPNKISNKYNKNKFTLCLLYSGTFNESSFLDSYCYNLKLKYMLLGFGSLVNNI